MTIAYNISEQSITVQTTSGRLVTRPRSRFTAEQWDSMRQALATGNEAAALRIMDEVAERISNYLSSQQPAGERNVWLSEGTIYTRRNGQAVPLHNAFTRYILEMAEANFPIGHLMKCLARLEKNPSAHSREQFFNFIQHNHQTIAPDGRVYFWKRVNKRTETVKVPNPEYTYPATTRTEERTIYRDVYTGNIDNAPGQVVRMPRRDVNDDPTQTCSHGLHVCSLPYARSYPGDALMAVLVDPADVVSVPKDYNHTKVRVCEYEVAREYDLTTIDDLSGDPLAVRNYQPDPDSFAAADDNEEWERVDDDDDDEPRDDWDGDVRELPY